MRVVSLACSNTEIVCALGRADLLVGVDSHSDFPSEVVSRLPRVGPDLDVDVDAVAALRPDLVLATLTVPGHERVVEALDEAGLPYVAPAPETIADVYRDISDIGQLLEAGERARELVEEMRRELGSGEWRSERRDGRAPGPEKVAPGPAGLRSEDGRPAGRPTILVQWWPKPTIAPGRRSWTTDVIRAAGGQNPLEREEVKSRPVGDEEVLALDPDAIVVSWCGVHPDQYRPDVLSRKEGWRELRAVREGRIHCVPEAWLGRPGPRLVEGARALRRIVADIGGSAPDR